MRIPAGQRNVDISVQYLDERDEKGPSPCVHVWFDGERTAETCEHQHRAVNEIWKIGSLDGSTGKLTLAPPPGAEPPPPPPAASSAPPPKATKPPKKK
jgi:hypothetical protein